VLSFATLQGRSYFAAKGRLIALFLRNLPETGALPSRLGSKPVPLITVIIVLLVVGVLLWLVNTYIPMDGKIKSILNAVVVIAVVIWLLQVFGLLETLKNIHIGG
jgi:hypothetical protein